ncbi:imm11 family protein [Paenibacillus xanthanilyticus]|uniref:Imm11 family protein n=1 Tax=Paenibacillus xanthanilyticus TaxID=1783531 RepID=A0ABV8JVL1_9BACL
MKIYRWDYESLFLLTTQQFSDYVSFLKGQPLIDEWPKIVIHDNEYRKGKYIDNSGFIGGSPLFSEKAKSVFQKLLEGKAEFLPVEHENGDVYYIVNIVNVLNCIDYETAIVNKTEIIENVFITEVQKYEFKEELVKDELMFKIPEDVVTRVFVTEEFIRIVDENGLVGFRFEEVWNSKKEEEIEKEMQYEKHLSVIKQHAGAESTFEEALNLMKEGKAFIHEGSKIQLDENGDLLIGYLQYTGKYIWISPVFIPPNFLELKWHEVEKSPL